MPTYDFACDAGHTHERMLPITSSPKARPACPEPGCGLRARRLVGGGGAINAQPCSSKYPYVSNRLPAGLPGCQHVGPREKPLIESRAHEDRILKTYGYARE